MNIFGSTVDSILTQNSEIASIEILEVSIECGRMVLTRFTKKKRDSMLIF